MNGLCSDHDAPDFPSVSGFESKDKSRLELYQTWNWAICELLEKKTISFQCSVGHYLLAFWKVVCWSSAHSVLLLDRTIFIENGSFIAQVRRCVVCGLFEAFFDFLSSCGEQVTQDLYKNGQCVTRVNYREGRLHSKNTTFASLLWSREIWW